MKKYIRKTLPKSISLLPFLISLIPIYSVFFHAEYLSQELEIDSSTKIDGNSSGFPTNPFEIVEMIRKQNSMNDATDPSDAIDHALESFNSLEEK
tara:strand:- start:307 stop:591 length:285 start_codon:yes stop_codon:yes gene_type:complete